MGIEIYLVRHGETEWNTQGRFQGRLDSPLTPNGREQARQFGLLLARVLNGYGGVMVAMAPEVPLVQLRRSHTASRADSSVVDHGFCAAPFPRKPFVRPLR